LNLGSERKERGGAKRVFRTKGNKGLDKMKTAGDFTGTEKL